MFVCYSDVRLQRAHIPMICMYATHIELCSVGILFFLEIQIDFCVI